MPRRKPRGIHGEVDQASQDTGVASAHGNIHSIIHAHGAQGARDSRLRSVDYLHGVLPFNAQLSPIPVTLQRLLDYFDGGFEAEWSRK